MTDPAKWDWADAASGAVMGVLGGVVSMFGWFSGRIGKVHDRIDHVHDRVSMHSTHIAVLTAHHEANLQFQERIDSTLTALDEKNDAQMKILLELKGRR